MAIRDEINFLKKKRDELNVKLNNMCPCKSIDSTCGKSKLYKLIFVQSGI